MTVQVGSTTRARRRSKVEQEKNVFQLKSGAHTGKFLVKAPNGRDERGKLLYKRYGPFASLDDAVAARDKHTVELAEQVIESLPLGRAGRAVTLSDWSKHWLDVQMANDNAASTVAKYRHSFNKHVLPFLGDIALGELTKEMVEVWRNGRKPVLGAESINYAIKRLKTCLNAAVASKRSTGLKENPALMVTYVESADEERPVSSFADYPKLIAAASEFVGEPSLAHLAPCIQFTVDSGCRASEVVALQWGDLELDRVDPVTGKPTPRVVLRRHMVSSGEAAQGTNIDAFRPGTKTSKGKPEYQAITPHTAALLKQHRAALAEHKLGSRPWQKMAGKATRFFYGKTKNDACGQQYVVPSNAVADDAVVFPSYDGQPMTTNNISGWFTRVGQRAGVKKTFHGMRHDCGSFMLADRVTLTVVSKHLRHATPAFTAKTYLHQIQEQEHMGVDAMDRRWAALEAQAEAA